MKLSTKAKLLIPDNTELISHYNAKSIFCIGDIVLTPLSDIKNLIVTRRSLGLAHAQSLAANESELPFLWHEKTIVFTASMFEKDGQLFMPALISSNGIKDATALSNRDSEWNIVLFNMKKIELDQVFIAELGPSVNLER